MTRDEYLIYKWPDAVPGQCTNPERKKYGWCLERVGRIPKEACESCQLFVKLQEEWNQMQVLVDIYGRIKEWKDKYDSYAENENNPLWFGEWLLRIAKVSARLQGRKLPDVGCYVADHPNPFVEGL